MDPVGGKYLTGENCKLMHITGVQSMLDAKNNDLLKMIREGSGASSAAALDVEAVKRIVREEMKALLEEIARLRAEIEGLEAKEGPPGKTGPQGPRGHAGPAGSKRLADMDDVRMDGADDGMVLVYERGTFVARALE